MAKKEKTMAVLSADQATVFSSVYEQSNAHFRFYLTWRQLLLSGFIAIYGALALSLKWAITSYQDFRLLPPILALVLSILFYFLDMRNRNLIDIAAESMRRLEEKLNCADLGYACIYNLVHGGAKNHRAMQDKHGNEAGSKFKLHLAPSHKRILTILYLGGAALAFAALLYCIIFVKEKIV